MTTPWDRSDDRLIAEKVEGWTVGVRSPLPDQPDFKVYFLLVDGRETEAVSEYNNNLFSAMRAAHHWSREELDHRGFWVGMRDSHDALPEACLYDNATWPSQKYWSQGESYADALARGLKKAVIGK